MSRKTALLLLLFFVGFDLVDDLFLLVPRPGRPFDADTPEVCALPPLPEARLPGDLQNEEVALPCCLPPSKPFEVVSAPGQPCAESGAELCYRLKTLIR